MMQVIVALILPYGWFAGVRYEQPQEQIHSVLFLCIRERVRVVSAQRLHYIVAVGSPWSRFTVCFNSEKKNT